MYAYVCTPFNDWFFVLLRLRQASIVHAGGRIVAVSVAPEVFVVDVVVVVLVLIVGAAVMIANVL